MITGDMWKLLEQRDFTNTNGIAWGRKYITRPGIARVTMDKALAVIELAKTLPQSAVALRFGMSQDTVSKIVGRRHHVFRTKEKAA